MLLRALLPLLRLHEVLGVWHRHSRQQSDFQRPGSRTSAGQLSVLTTSIFHQVFRRSFSTRKVREEELRQLDGRFPYSS